VPEYRTEKGTPYHPENVQMDECPVSLISPAAQHLVMTFLDAKLVRDSTGAVLYGTDLRAWPVKMHDAAVLIERCRIAEHNARVMAEIAESRQ
jgi:hypothetical protein